VRIVGRAGRHSLPLQLIMRHFTVVCILFLLLMLVSGEYNISTYAGIGCGDGLVATSAVLTNPFGVSIDSSGNLYIADTYAHKVRKVDSATNLVSTVAGSGNEAYSGNGGKATSAELQTPIKVALDASKNIYIADQNNNVIRKVTVSTGIITTVAGKGSTAGTVTDSIAATSSKLYYPSDIALGMLNF